MLFGGLGLALLAVVGLAYLPVDNWPLDGDDLSTLLIGWGAILAGVAFHFGVGMTKRVQNPQMPQILALGSVVVIAGPRYALTIAATSAAKSSLRFSMPSPTT